MKLTTLSLLAITASAVSARFTEEHEIDQVVLHPENLDNELFNVETEPGTILRVTEEGKWDLKRYGINFMDVTDYPDLGALNAFRTTKSTPTFPSKLSKQKVLKSLIRILSKLNMRNHLEKFTSFHTRYYKSDYGRQSSEWLLGIIEEAISDAGAGKTVYATPFPHPWGQSSIIVTIPGKTNSTVVIGAHQDSTNLFFPSFLAAPGADDDGSGTVTNLEAFRVLLEDKDAVGGELENTIEFHWYSAEEGGLLGSQAIFSSYEKEGRQVRAMLQQDMTGYVQKTINKGEPVSIGVMTDYVNAPLTEFVKIIIKEYCAIPYVETSCGYACSDHASADKAGYPSSFVTESEFSLSNGNIHGTGDTMDKLDFDHMLEHAKLAVGFVYELAAANLE